MAYSFTSTESLGIPEQITLVDTSTSPSPGLTSRRISFRLANGNWLTTAGESTTIAYETWPIADVSITLSILSRSTVADVKVDWMTAAVETGTSTVTTGYVLFDYLFAYNLIGAQTSSPGIVQDTNYYSSFSQFIVNLFCAETATSYEDIYSAQSALNRNYLMEQNENSYF